jgi:hypothetical protein
MAKSKEIGGNKVKASDGQGSPQSNGLRLYTFSEPSKKNIAPKNTWLEAARHMCCMLVISEVGPKESKAECIGIVNNISARLPAKVIMQVISHAESIIKLRQTATILVKRKGDEFDAFVFYTEEDATNFMSSKPGVAVCTPSLLV